MKTDGLWKEEGEWNGATTVPLEGTMNLSEAIERHPDNAPLTAGERNRWSEEVRWLEEGKTELLEALNLANDNAIKWLQKYTELKETE